MFRDTTIDNNWWYTVCQVTYNIWSIDSSNAIIQFTRICASLVGCNIYPTISLLVSSFLIVSSSSGTFSSISLLSYLTSEYKPNQSIRDELTI